MLLAAEQMQTVLAKALFGDAKTYNDLLSVCYNNDNYILRLGNTLRYIYI